MVRFSSANLPSVEEEEEQQQQQQQQQGEDDSFRFTDDLNSFFPDNFSDFDPVKEWLIDPDHDPMSDHYFDALESRNLDELLGHHQDLTSVEPPIDEKMEKVTLIESQLDHITGVAKINSDGVLNVGLVADEAKNHGVVGEGVSNGPVADEVNNDGANDVKDDAVEEVCSACESDEEESSEEESSSKSSSSEEDESSSNEEDEDESDDGNDSDEDDKREMVDAEIEEGEIKGDDLYEMMLDCDEEEDVPKGPIRSKHEIENLPPVPPLEVSLEPHHQTLPVGFVSSILGNRLIVEGSEKHSPLNEGSILWITETRSPLGIIDEIFGPVKNPYYVVRYNSDKDVPPRANVGVAVSFVIDYANHVLNDKSLYEKGYDASGVDDEEAIDEVEFSDDEKEAEYKRSLQQKKRDTSHENKEAGHWKKGNSKGARFQRNKQLQSPHSLAARATDQPMPIQRSQVHGTQAMTNFGFSNSNSAHMPANLGSIAPSPAMVPAFPSQLQASQMGTSCAFGNAIQQFNSGPMQGFPPHTQPSGMQGGFLPQAHPLGMLGGLPFLPQSTAMQGGFPMNWLQGQQSGYQTCNLQQQNAVFNNCAGGITPGILPGVGGPVNPPFGPSSTLLGLMGQGGFNQVSFGCGNMNPQGSLVLNNEQSHGQGLPAVDQGNMRPPVMQFNGSQFNRGGLSSRGQRPYLRGGRQPFDHRGGQQHNGHRNLS